MSALPSTARNLVVVVLDSLRYDSWLAAKPASLSGLGRPSGGGATPRGPPRRTTTCSWACCRTRARRTSTPRSTTSGLPALHRAAWACPDIEFKQLLPVDLPADLPEARARLPHPRARLDAGAQPVHADQPRLRLLRADADAQRHGGDRRRSCASTRSARRSGCSTSARPTIRTRWPGQDSSDLPHISGVHGVFKHLDEIRAERRANRPSSSPSAAEGTARAPDRRARVPRRCVRAPARAAARRTPG